MNVSTEHGLICWFWSIQYWTNTKSSISDILHSMNKHHRDSKANSLNESGPVTKLWGGECCGLRTPWHRRCTVERKLKCSNVNMWRPEFGQSLWSFHRKIFRLFCNLLQHCARISYHRKTSKGFFFVWKCWVSDLSQWRCLRHAKTYADSSTSIPTYRTENGWLYKDWLHQSHDTQFYKRSWFACAPWWPAVLLIYYKIWQDLELCHGCRWLSKTTELFDLFWFLISFNRVQLLSSCFHALSSKYENLPCHSTESRESPGRKLVASGRKQHWSERLVCDER